MLPQHVLLALAAAVSAVPLNINLGAYSPALVVGDGEISLGSTESASELMATLASGAAGNGGGEEQPAEGEAAKRAPVPNLVRTVEHFGKRAENDRLGAVEDAMEWIKRDLPGFKEALTYAREAMQNTPKIELGSEGAGVGIVVSPGLNVPANSAAAGAGAEKKARKVKRDEVVAEESDSPKMTLVAITEV
ncbi:hypothetical protein BS50DRAFT_508437 [Corynespora cassiicola Philippines]|uniref:Uncharacterized protein n=1 Tax=Corynespora cassiicola Philippines TaxID=1448308 RepID=A0A2T2N1X9_CORCC|nr:hypothetical protein BS50DRAFT_508437 [Corynespora cassiicola Philippines]